LGDDAALCAVLASDDDMRFETALATLETLFLDGLRPR